MKVLITTPELGLPGGVAFYYKTLKPHFVSDVTYFTIGKRSTCTGTLNAIWQLLKDYWFFLVAIYSTNYDVIHFNPSLGARSFLRDSIFIALAKICRKRVVVFFHGWDLDYEEFSERYLLWLYKLTYFNAEAIIVLAEQFKNKLTSLGYRGNLFVETTVVGDDVFDEFSLNEKSYNNGFINILYL